MSQVQRTTYKDPFVSIERRCNLLLPSDTTKKSAAENIGQENKVIRKVKTRKIGLSVLATLATFGIYGIFWMYEIAKETDAVCRENKSTAPSLVVFLSIITCGIYGVYWSYKTGLKHNAYLWDKRQEDNGFQVLYLVLFLSNYLVPFLNLVVAICVYMWYNKFQEVHHHEAYHIEIEEFRPFLCSEERAP